MVVVANKVLMFLHREFLLLPGFRFPSKISYKRSWSSAVSHSVSQELEFFPFNSFNNLQFYIESPQNVFIVNVIFPRNSKNASVQPHFECLQLFHSGFCQRFHTTELQQEQKCWWHHCWVPVNPKFGWALCYQTVPCSWFPLLTTLKAYLYRYRELGLRLNDQEQPIFAEPTTSLHCLPSRSIMTV